MTNTEITQRINFLIPEGNWGAFYGDASNEQEFEEAFLFNGTGKKPTWQEVCAVVLPTPTEPTVADKLASVGLSLNELKTALLGGN